MTNHTKFKEDNEIRSKTDNSFSLAPQLISTEIVFYKSTHFAKRNLSLTELDFCPKINFIRVKSPINARKIVCSCLNEYLKNHHSFWKTFCLISHGEDTCYTGSKNVGPCLRNGLQSQITVNHICEWMCKTPSETLGKNWKLTKINKIPTPGGSTRLCG